MKILLHQPTATIIPYNRLDNEPPQGLSSDYLILNQVETPPPTITETQSLVANWVIDEVNLEYRQEWTVVDNPPVVNWDGFNEAILSDTAFNQTTGIVLQNAPAIALALPAALAQVASNGVTSFGLAFNPFCAVGGVTVAQRGLWADMAESSNLPIDFVEVIRG